MIKSNPLNIATNLTALIEKKLIDRIGYWSNGSFDLLVDQSSGNLNLARQSTGSTGKWLFVIARQHYFETVRDYPVGQLKDLKNILQNEPWRFPYEGKRFDKIERTSLQSHKVTTWIIKKEVIEGMGARTFWLIPESECIATALSDSHVTVERLNQDLNVSKTLDGLVSSVGDREEFFQQIGASVLEASGGGGASLTRLSEPEALNMLLAGLKNTMLASPLLFFSYPKIASLSHYSWREAAKLSGLSFVAYLLLTSLYLIASDTWLTHKLEKSRPLVESSVTLKNEVSEIKEKLDTIRLVLTDLPPLWLTWDLFLDLLNNDVTFRAVNSTSPSVTYYMTAPRATDVLVLLKSDARVQSVEFALPVQKVSGLDQFALEVKFKQQTPARDQSLIGDASASTEGVRANSPGDVSDDG